MFLLLYIIPHTLTLSSLLPCMIFIQHLSPSNILFDLFIIYCLSHPPKYKTHKAAHIFVHTVSPAPKPEKMLNSCWMNEWMNVWMDVFCLAIGWNQHLLTGDLSVRALLANGHFLLCLLLDSASPINCLIGPTFFGLSFFPRSFLNGYDLDVYRSGAHSEVIKSDSEIIQHRRVLPGATSSEGAMGK